MTSIFKEYLVYDEPIEFLKRKYHTDESHKKLKSLNEYYNAYFKVFPNFILLPEKYYMYKNIERKQRVIDDQQYRMILKNEEDEINQQAPSYSKLFNESYKKSISMFRNNFNKEEVSLGKVDPQLLFDPRKTSLSSFYSKEAATCEKSDKAGDSLEMVLKRVDTSWMQLNNGETENSVSLSFCKNRNSSIHASDIGDIPNTPQKRSIKERKSRVFDLNLPGNHQEKNIVVKKLGNQKIGLPPTNPGSHGITANTSQVVTNEESKNSTWNKEKNLSKY